jgi:predicted nucleic acid-binding protein
MRRAVVDASALAAVAFREPVGVAVASRLEGREAHAPWLLRYEIANVALQLCRRQPSQSAAVLDALAHAVGPESGIQWHDVDPVDVVHISRSTGLTAYDASYLWLAGQLGADLVTLDRELVNASKGQI